MLKKTILLISISVLVFFVGMPHRSFAQNEGFELYDLLVFCGTTGLTSATFGHRVTEGGTAGRPLMGTKTFCVGKTCSGGPVTLAAALAQVPPKVAAALQAKVDKYQENLADGEDWFLTCLGEGSKKLSKEPPPPVETKPEKRGEPDPITPDASVASAATANELVEVTIRCPTSGRTVSINWKNHLDGHYSDTGGPSGVLDFEYVSGSNEASVPFDRARRNGQKIECTYKFLGSSGAVISAYYAYKVKREIVSCFNITQGMKCKVKP